MKNVLITGATGGIGSSILKNCLANGNRVLATGSDRDKLFKLKETHQRATVVQLDLTKPELFDSFAQELLPLDGIVFASGSQYFMPAKFINPDLAHKMMDVNFWGPVLLLQQILRQKKITNGASIIFISSISSHLGVKAQSIYAATKGALDSFMRSLASELASSRIRVNSVAPGIIKTELFDKMGDRMEDTTAVKDLQRYPFGFGEVEDLLGLITYLLSDQSKWMTGQIINIEGGLTLY
jgi:NAD(P)-dependent dehydrogenase (short-subunit alcohol dehydrogenase family)